MLVPPTKIDPLVGISNSTHIFDFWINWGIVSIVAIAMNHELDCYFKFQKWNWDTKL